MTKLFCVTLDSSLDNCNCRSLISMGRLFSRRRLVSRKGFECHSQISSFIADVSNLYWKHHKQWKPRKRWFFLHCRNWVITINQKLNESYGINHTVQRNNRFNILCLLNCLPWNLTYSNSLPLCYLYVSMNFSSLIHGSYPRVFR